MTSLQSLLSISLPIIQGGMGNISSSELAAAVSRAGGLGTIGVGTLPLDEIENRLTHLQALTERPICVNLPLAVHPDIEKVVEMVLEKKVPVVSLSAGNPAPYIPTFKKNGVKVLCVTGSVKQALKAAEAGADVIVCEGFEAAGINAPNESTTMTLIPQVVQQVSCPVVAAGGIGDGRGLAAALSLGAAGVQMGTRLIATQEAPYHLAYKEALLQATDASTVIVGRRFNRIRRLLQTEGSHSILDFEGDVSHTVKDFLARTDEAYHVLGAVDGDLSEGFVNAGQIAGLIKDVPTVEELFESMMLDAKRALDQASERL